ncbi:hypothetical protein NHJ13051_008518 [Beauveria bassiana]
MSETATDQPAAGPRTSISGASRQKRKACWGLPFEENNTVNLNDQDTLQKRDKFFTTCSNYGLSKPYWGLFSGSCKQENGEYRNS